MQQINFYRQRVAINVLAKDIANAREIYDAADGHAVIGVLSAQFASVEDGVQEVRRWMADVPSISVGLGAGDPAQYYKAAMSAAKVHPAHVNQTFTGCALPQARWRQQGANRRTLMRWSARPERQAKCSSPLASAVLRERLPASPVTRRYE